MKKRTMTLVITVLLLLTTTACGHDSVVSTPVSDETPSITTTTTTTTTKPTTTTTAKPTTTTTKPTTTTTVKPTTTTTKKPEELIRLGRVKGNQYENERLGIGCTLSDDWTFYTEQELKELNDITADMDEKEISDYLKIIEAYYDVAATSEDGCYLTATIEPLDEEFINNVNMEEFFSKVVVPQLKYRMSTLGFTTQQTWKNIVTIDGKEFPAAIAFGSAGDFTRYAVTVGIQRGKHLYGLTVTAYNQQTAISVLNQFYFL